MRSGVSGQLMFSKTIIVFDKDVDVQNVSEAAWIAGTHVDPQRDIQFTVGPMDDLENASNLPAYGSKMGIDATRKWPGEGFTREWPTRLKTTDAASRKADELLKSIAKESSVAASVDDVAAKVEAGEPLSDARRRRARLQPRHHRARHAGERPFGAGFTAPR